MWLMACRTGTLKVPEVDHRNQKMLSEYIYTAHQITHTFITDGQCRVSLDNQL